MTSALQHTFTAAALRHLAGSRSFDRGVDYFHGRRVRSLVVSGDEASAVVGGTHDYRVRLWIDDGGPGHECSCPVGETGEMCKHGVAVGLALADREAPSEPGSGPTTPDIRSHLLAQDKEALVDLILDQARGDHLLWGRLELEAAKTSGDEVNLDAYRHAVDQAVEVDDFLPYGQVYGYSEGVGEVVASIRTLLDGGHGAEVVVLCEYALKALEDALGYIDDSDGSLGWRRDELAELHLQACGKSRPDPVALAERLFHWELHSEWDTFYRAVAVYADALGPDGLATYRNLAEEAWERVPSRTADDDREFSSFRSQLTRIMETLAEMSGDVDAVVAVKARDLSLPHHYGQIAEVLSGAGRHDDALTWVERGLAAFPGVDSGLGEIAADQYHRRGRHDEAMALAWAMFTERSDLATYQRLHHHATLADAGSDWRAKALDTLRKKAKTAKTTTEPWSRWRQPLGYSTLVEVFLWEGDPDSAWVEAETGGCSDELWMRLAGARADDHPADSLPIYQAQVERLIQVKKNHAYAEAVEWMGRVGDLLTRMDRGDEFPAYAADVRARHKPKRNLMELLDAAGW